ncbi:Isochorismate synthase, chloroplastic-like protein [Drosera capensis]
MNQTGLPNPVHPGVIHFITILTNQLSSAPQTRFPPLIYPQRPPPPSRRRPTPPDKVHFVVSYQPPLLIPGMRNLGPCFPATIPFRISPVLGILRRPPVGAVPAIVIGCGGRIVVRNADKKRHVCVFSLSMNGCQGDSRVPVGTIETRTLAPVAAPGYAVDCLVSAVSELSSISPSRSSGIIRLEVPIKQEIKGIEWLHAQSQLLPCFYFSGRHKRGDSGRFINSINNGNGSPNGAIGCDLVSVAGVGAAVYFKHVHPFSFDDWRSIKRFLSKSCPRIRAYGAIRFDSKADISKEWEAFGSFYFMVPQVELNEFEGSSLLAVYVAWDNYLSWEWKKAIDSLKATLNQMNVHIIKLRNEVPKSAILSTILHTPNVERWNVSVTKALQMINNSSSALTKADGGNAYQFCLQPSDGSTFIGNTPEQLFHRKQLNISSEALAGTRARCGSRALDHEIELDLLASPKENLEFTIVRESIRRKLEANPQKAVRKLSRVQHLFAKLKGNLRSEDDEFDVLSSLHPSPAVCGFPTEEARLLIAETESFDRGMYAGPVGWFGGDEAEFAVGIRSALVKKGLGALVYAGTGIVEGSNPSLEWEELDLKISQVVYVYPSEQMSLISFLFIGASCEFDILKAVDGSSLSALNDISETWQILYKPFFDS